ncbi:MAG: substrate-binding domain-containing protein [Burkholderiales bacterium]
MNMIQTMVAIMTFSFGTSAAMAADIKVMSAGAVEPGLEKLAEAFHKTSGHKVIIKYGTAPQLAKRLAEGEAADILIAPPRVLDDQVKAGKVEADGRVAVGRVGVGVTVRSKGGPTPSIDTVDALRAALLGADSIVLNRASTGLYLDSLFAKMGIADALKTKATRYDNGASVLEHVIAGKGNEIGFGAITEIKLFEPKGVRCIGPLPAEAQNYTNYSAGMMTGASAVDAAKEFVRYLVTPEAKKVFASTGVD